MKSLIVWIIGIAAGAGVVVLLVWFFFFNKPAPVEVVQTQNAGLGTGSTVSVGTQSNTTSENESQTIPLSTNTSQKVFKVTDGPVTGAAFLQTLNPTTTIIRYVLQENGHVLDQAIDVPGSVARAVSNTTIPGTQRALWAPKAAVAYLQYIDGGVVKTVSLAFPLAATSSTSVTKPVEIKFLPNNMLDVAVSPDGSQIAYLLRSEEGSDGYVANPDGSNSKKIFSIGFSQLLISWPAPNTLLLTTKSNATAQGVLFSVGAKTGEIVPLVYGRGLTATADRSLSDVVYQVVSGSSRSTYLHNIKNGTDVALSFDPIPEKCAWSTSATSTLYCAAPLAYTDSNYLDLWHMGLASGADTIVSFIPSLNSATRAIAVPGSADGGVVSDVLELAVSPDNKYLLFVKKGDRSLWAVRLMQ